MTISEDHMQDFMTRTDKNFDDLFSKLNTMDRMVAGQVSCLTETKDRVNRLEKQEDARTWIALGGSVLLTIVTNALTKGQVALASIVGWFLTGLN